MAVAGQVHRHARDGRAEVGAVIEVEATQEVLVGLAVTGMLRDDQAGHDLQQLAGAQARTVLQLLRGRDTAAGAAGERGGVVWCRSRDDDRLQLCDRRALQASGESGGRKGDGPEMKGESVGTAHWGSPVEGALRRHQGDGCQDASR